MVNAFMTDDEQTWSAASAIAHDFLTKHKNNDVHIVTAVGMAFESDLHTTIHVTFTGFRTLSY